MRKPLFFFTLTLLLSVTCCLASADALTERCEFFVSSNPSGILRIVDDNPDTVWASAGEDEPYLEIKMPTTRATISILWGGPLRKLTVEALTDEGWQVITVMENPDPMPKTLLVTTPAQQVRLRGEGEMRIAELRVTTGLTDSYFADHIFRGNVVVTATRLDDTCADDTPPSVAAMPMPYDTTQTMPRTASALVQFSHDQVGKGYIYGTAGVISSRSLRRHNARQYPAYSSTLLSTAEKWDGMEVFDCIGLIKAFMSRSEGPFPSEWNTNVNGAVKRWVMEMGPLDTMPREPGILLLRMRPNSRTEQYEHIGIYVGNGKCIHARGHAYGVVEEPMPHLWTHWARPVWLEYNLPAEEPTPWRPYLAPGDLAQIDTPFEGAIGLLDNSPSNWGRTFGARIPNKAYVVVEGYAEDERDSQWRRVTYTNEAGVSRTGYVSAKNLSPVPVPTLAMDTGDAVSY